MPISTSCPKCRTPYTLADQQAGKKVRCRECQSVFIVGAGAASRPAGSSAQIEIVSESPRPKARSASSITTRRPGASRPARGDDEDDCPRRRRYDNEDEAPRGRGLLVGICVAAGVLLIGGGITLAIAMRGGDDKDKQVATTTPPPVQPFQGGPGIGLNPLPNPGGGTPVVKPPTPDPVLPKPADPPVDFKPVDPVVSTDPKPKPPPDPEPKPKPKRPAEDDEPEVKPAPRGDGKIPREAVVKAKKATVYIKVTMADGSMASGTGFFGVPEARNLVLTNAHVVGMLSSTSRQPRAVEVYIDSGQAEERRLPARVLGVDRSSDLSVLDVGTTEGLPEPLVVKSARDLVELDNVYTFGFPLGERLGKEITIRPTSVSSLRKKHGALDRVQVSGGMDPGNSGGPVVDANGHVVGVAVAGIEGRLINFAIPGDYVHTILNGRISELGTRLPYVTADGRLAVPITMVMVDPRQGIKEVALDVWTSDAPAAGKGARPPADKEPTPEPGDSEHLHYKLPYGSGIAKGEIAMPPLPAGKVFWIQPNWVNGAGKGHWATAQVWRPPGQPVVRKPAMLAVRFPMGASRSLELTSNSTFRVAGEDDEAPPQMRTGVLFEEKVISAAPTGTRLRLQYQKAGRDFIFNKKVRPSALLASLQPDIPFLAAVVQLDGQGNVTQNTIDPSIMRRLIGPTAKARRDAIQDFHEPVKNGIDALSVPLPGRDVQPMETWTAARPLPIDTPRRFELGEIDVTYTYLGQRNRNGKDEAVIDINGQVRPRPGAKAQFTGKVEGLALVDLATGQISESTANLTLDMEVGLSDAEEGSAKTIRVINNAVYTLKRGL